MNDVAKKSILIVDDERANISMIRSILSPEYTIYASRDGQDALDTAMEFLPDVILLDIIMPTMDGYEVITELKKNRYTRDIPVIFITGLNSIEAEEKGLSLGAADYIHKPFHAPIVKIRVKNQINIIERYELEKDLNVVLKLQSDLVAAKLLAEYNGKVAEYASRAKSEFLARMSHEMRTPMNAIMGMLQVIKMRGTPDNIQQYFDKIDSSSAHLLSIIDDLLDVSSTEYGSFKLNEAVFNFNTLISGISSSTRHSASEKQQTFISNIDPSIPASLIGDEKNMRRVLFNLLANAVKFTPENGEIKLDVSILESDDKTITLQIDITDNGMGMTKEQQEMLFELFEQVDGSNTRKYSGIGIGLPLSKSIANMMHGDISVVSEINNGSKFTFTCVLRKVS